MKYTLRFSHHFNLDFDASVYTEKWVITFYHALRQCLYKGEELDPHWKLANDDSPQARGRRFAFLVRVFCSQHMINLETLTNNIVLFETREDGTRKELSEKSEHFMAFYVKQKEETHAS